MVALDAIRASNAALGTTLPERMVGVFAGATAGIGEFTLKSFAQNAAQPRLYFIGRNKEAGARITKELEELNPKGDYHFIAADTSLLRNVDKACEEIRGKEEFINVLVLTQGGFKRGFDTDEKLHFPIAVSYYARMRFVANLLPLLERAPWLRRVVSVLSATKEGTIDTSNLQARNMTNMLAWRRQNASMQTLALAHFAAEHPRVSFVHTFPGFVKTTILNGVTGWFFAFMRIVMVIIAPFMAIPADQSGDTHVYVATSARFPAHDAEGEVQGVKAKGKDSVATRSIDGKEGSGVYAINEYAEPAAPATEQLLAKLREDGTAEMVWKDLEDNFVRVTGKKSISG